MDALLSILNLTSSYSQSDKLSSGYSVNILAQQSAKTLADVSVKIYANQPGEYFSGYKSADILRYSNLSHSKRGEFTPFIKGDFSHLSKEANYPHWQGLIGVTTQGRIEFFEPIKKGRFLPLAKNFDDNHFTFLLTFGYSKNALAKSSVRICSLSLQTATHDAPCVFFCVYAYAYLLNAVLYRSYSMVALVRQLNGWLVSVCTSTANLVNVTTPIEICSSSGDSELTQAEIIVMMATPTQTQFKFLFLAVKRTDKTDTPHRIEATASNEHDARLMLVRDYILSFAGRLPVKEVAHA
ncbi:host cell division inhibitor Icd-like protein, partial [Proteus mirabilis]